MFSPSFTVGLNLKKEFMVMMLLKFKTIKLRLGYSSGDFFSLSLVAYPQYTICNLLTGEPCSLVFSPKSHSTWS